MIIGIPQVGVCDVGGCRHAGGGVLEDADGGDDAVVDRGVDAVGSGVGGDREAVPVALDDAP